MQLSLAYPWWFVPACLALGLAYAWLTYGFSSPFSKPKRLGLGLLRTLAVSLLAFLLLEPVLRRQLEVDDKPQFVVLSDVSASMGAHPQGDAYRAWLNDSLSPWLNSLEETYQTHWLSFDREVLPGKSPASLQGNQTNLSAALEAVSLRFANQSVAAVLLMSDGIVNQGMDPTFKALDFPFPLYTMPLGDTTRFADARVVDIRHNEIAYLGNTFPVEVFLEADRLAGETLQIRLLKGGEVVEESSWKVNGARDAFRLEYTPEAKNVGLQRYSVEVSLSDSDKLPANNTEDFVVEVIDSRQKVLIVGAAPHPDLGALAQALGQSADLEVETSMFDEVDPTGLKKYSLVILHNLPKKNPGWLSKLKALGIPAWFILGSQTQLEAFNSLETLLRITGSNAEPDLVTGLMTPNFRSFQPEADWEPTDWPPLLSPYGNYQALPPTEVFMQRKVGRVNTGQLLWGFASLNDWKHAVLAGEGLWRWRLHYYKNHNSFSGFDATLRKAVQWLALREDKSRFRVRTKAKFASDQNVRFFAEVYDEALEPLPNQQMALELTHESGANYSFYFNASAQGYSLDAGLLPQGIYQWKAIWEGQAEVKPRTGSIQVISSKQEISDLRTRLQVLQTLSQSTGGKMLAFGDTKGLEQLLSETPSSATVIRKELQLDPLLDALWWLLLIAGLLLAEWVLRKYFGRI